MAGQVVTILSIAELPSHLRAGDLLALDIDETLVRPEHDATEPWFNEFAAAVKSHAPICDRLLFCACVELWCALQAVCECTAPEGDATRQALVAAAAMPGVECVGLTARAPDIHDETAEQLSRLGLFDGNFATHASLGALAPPPGFVDEYARPPLTHIGGIIYCSGSRKPAGLRAFEAAAGIPHARRVVLLDDRRAHCEAVGTDRASRGQPFLGLHYAPSGAPDKCALPRGWQLVAAAVARRAGRRRLRSLLDQLDQADEDAPSGAGAWGAVLRGHAPCVLALAAGTCIGAVTCWAAMRRRR